VALLPHEIDKHLVSSSIYLTRVASALESIDLRTVPTDRRAVIKDIRTEIADLIKKLEIARVGEEGHARRRRA
jgi:hypothetical protein